MLTQQLRNSYCYSAWTWRFLLPPPTLPAPIPAGAASPSTTAIPAGPWHSHGSPPLSHQDPFQAGVSHEDCIYIYKSISWKGWGGWLLEAETITAQLIKGESGFIKAIKCFTEDFCLSGQNFQLGPHQCQEALHPCCHLSQNHCWHHFWYGNYKLVWWYYKFDSVWTFSHCF